MSPTLAPVDRSAAARPIAEARVSLASMLDAHARGRHYMRWTGRLDDGRRAMGCMFCARRTLESV